ncbi:MAG: hypothetical protein H6842_09815 [Rhodospirillaceae bacterium]|nr:hypothetical protein [Rhodospirillaceae bacterium]
MSGMGRRLQTGLMSLVMMAQAAAAAADPPPADAPAATAGLDPACAAQLDGKIPPADPLAVHALATWQTTRVDGGGGRDTYRLRGPDTFLFDGVGVVSIERIAIDNGLFDTVAVLEPLFATTEDGEVEIDADWFDTVILDPGLDWRRSLDVGGADLVVEAEAGQATWRVFAPFDVHLVTAPAGAVLTTAAWDAGAGPSDAGPAWQGVAVGQVGTRPGLRWTAAGGLDLEVPPGVGADGPVVVDIRNAAANRLRLDLRMLAGLSGGTLAVDADPQDRLELLQPACWSAPDTPTSAEGRVLLRTLPTLLDGIALVGQPSLLPAAPPEGPRPVRMRADGAGFYHLSADLSHIVGEIDLRDGVATTLMIRLGGHLATDRPIPVSGDAGLDAVWLDGSAGWVLKRRGGAVAATVPARRGRAVTLQFGAGLRLAVLPAPPYLTDPRLAQVGHYPAMPDETMGAPGLYLPRGGFVRLSPTQLAGLAEIDLTNGIANVFDLDPAALAGAAPRLMIQGDIGLDIVRAPGLAPIGNHRPVVGGTAVFGMPAGSPAEAARVIVRGLSVTN